MNVLYLDYNCFQRMFDDQRQIKIQLESLACEEIFRRAEKKQVKLIWSFMHEDENSLCPFPERKLLVEQLSSLCNINVVLNETIFLVAKSYQQKGNLSSKDAIHVACAEYAKCKVFLTCDIELITRSIRLQLDFPVLNPLDYVSKGTTL
ncbi:MAG: PIN domain-containing protein [Ignavibacteriae bacterium]|nr:PIN domain-containing protein [Ignavibacteriota bacterium]